MTSPSIDYLSAPVRPDAAPPAEPEVLLSASGLGRTFWMGDAPLSVLRDVNFRMRDGEFVAIEGRSGSGKSTLLHVLAALDSVDTGTLNFDGRDYTRRVPGPLPGWLRVIGGDRRESPVTARTRFAVYALALVLSFAALLGDWTQTSAVLNRYLPDLQLPDAGTPTRPQQIFFLVSLVVFVVALVVRLTGWGVTLVLFARRLAGEGPAANLRNRAFGFVFQSYHLLPELNVLENTMLAPSVELPWWRFLATRKALRARASQILSQVGLGQRMRHRPGQLSGGERQRVAIARALMNNPRILFADEPTGNLDYETGRQIMDVLETLHRDHGQTIVMVTHDRSLAREADRVLVLENGRLREAETSVQNAG